MPKVSSWKIAFVLCAFCLVAAISSPAQTFTTLYSFCSQINCADGTSPQGELVQGTDGNLYGTTDGYGANGSGGTVFKVTTGGSLTTLYSFCDTVGCWQNGDTPEGPLVLATNGDLYGTTRGPGAGCPAGGCGTVYKITPAGALTTLYGFCSQTNCTDGESPNAGLVQATNLDLYGTTEFGGAYPNCYAGLGAVTCGTIFEITPRGRLTTLHNFCAQIGCPDGYFPQAASLIQASDGNLYGVTPYGGAYCVPLGCGTVFKMTLNGTFTTLYSFCESGGNCPDGAVPGYFPGTGPGLVQGSDGNFYGTTSVGGTYNLGTVFRITPAGKLKTLYSFDGGTDGAYPQPGLIQATDGNFYGITSAGNNAGPSGTIFSMTPGGTLTTLHTFCSEPNCTDGAFPSGGLVQATNGAFYGTTSEGGASLFDGTVFSLSVGLKPFVETNPTSGKVGTKVTILGNNLTGSTSVTFNGAPAGFTAHGTYITTTVPSGATTGFVRVTTPSGTLTSNVKFRVP